MTPRRRALSAALATLSLALCPAWPPAPARAWADDAEWAAAVRTTREHIAAAGATLSGESPGQKLAAMAEQAGTDPRALAGLYRAHEEYVARTLAEWRDGPERTALQEAGRRLQRSAERAAAELRAATDSVSSAEIRMRHSGVLGNVGRLEAAAKEAGMRLAARWERERAMREREKEQREREAGERAREQRR